MDAELIAVGTELMLLGRPDTNGGWLCGRLAGLGVVVRQRVCVEDDTSRIAAAVRAALGRARLVVLTGGLGPTEDDRTREALAEALGVPLERDAAKVDALARGYARRGYRFRDSQARQADRPRGASWLDNPVGSAPGLLVETGEGALVAALPGVPEEMRATFERGLAPLLAARNRGARVRLTLRVAGRTESGVDEAVRDLYGSDGVGVTVLTARDGVELHLAAGGPDAEETRRRVDRLAGRIAERLGPDLYGRDEDTLAGVVGALLAGRGLTLAVAESCTGGLIGAAITAVPGSSAWFRGGVVVYADDLKTGLAGVRPATLAEHGAVSEAAARELAEGARTACGADLGIGVTGVAGPAGGTPAKPVGRVHVALADAEGTRAWRLDLPGDRERVRTRACAFALDRVRRRLEPE